VMARRPHFSPPGFIHASCRWFAQPSAGVLSAQGGGLLSAANDGSGKNKGNQDMTEVFETRLAHAKKLEARGLRLKSDAADPSFMEKLAEARAIDCTTKMLAAGEIDPRDWQSQANFIAELTEDPQRCCIEGKRLDELADRALEEIQALDAAEAKRELEARQAREIEVHQLSARRAQERTERLQKENQARAQRIEAMEARELEAKQRVANAGVQQLIAHGLVDASDSSALECFRQQLTTNPETLRLLLRLRVEPAPRSLGEAPFTSRLDFGNHL
jgi:hypothetical protein